MTLNEFRAWLEGFEASFDGAPSAEQWQFIKNKLATVDPLHSWPNLKPEDARKLGVLRYPNDPPLGMVGPYIVSGTPVVERSASGK